MKRPFVDASAEQNDAAPKEIPAPKERRTDERRTDAEQDDAPPPPPPPDAWWGSTTRMVLQMELPIGKGCKKDSAPCLTHEQRFRKILRDAECHFAHWWHVVQREKMQLQAHLDGNRHCEKMGLEPIKNKNGVIIAHVDPDPDIDRLHIKVWSPGQQLDSKYICFLDSKLEDTIAEIKEKIQEHPDVTLKIKDMKVFYKGAELADSKDLIEMGIDDDCILHVAHKDHANLAIETSKPLHQWKHLPGFSRSVANLEAKIQAHIQSKVDKTKISVQA